MGGIVTEPKLLLNEFKTLHRVLKRGLPPWASFLVLGFLVWVEERFIQQRVTNTVDETPVRGQQPTPIGVPPGTNKLVPTPPCPIRVQPALSSPKHQATTGPRHC
jgi:hypothetical protein